MNKRFIVLDSYRGLFAFIVAIYHYKASGPIGQFSLFQQGDYFVDFFFVLSGFIIYHTYQNLTSGEAQVRFMKNRFFRLYPLHIIMLFVFLVMETAKYILYAKGLFKNPVFERNNLTTFIYNVFFAQSFCQTPAGWNYPSWSISAEMVTYLFFCLSIVYINKLQLAGRVSSFLAVSLTSLLLIYVVKGDIDIKMINNYSMLRCMYGFFLGCLMYEVYKRNQSPSKIISVLEVVTLLGSLLLTAYLPEQLSFLLPISFALTVLVFSFEGGILSTLLNNRLFNKIGELSYSIYMTHAAIAIVFEIVLGVLKIRSPLMLSAGTAIYLLTIFIVSTFTHKYIEIQLRKRIQKKPTSAFVNEQINPNTVNLNV